MQYASCSEIRLYKTDTPAYLQFLTYGPNLLTKSCPPFTVAMLEYETLYMGASGTSHSVGSTALRHFFFGLVVVIVIDEDFYCRSTQAA